MIKRFAPALFLALAASLVSNLCLAQEVTIDLSVTPREVPANGEVVVRLLVSGPGAENATLESRPRGRILIPRGIVGTSSSIQIINGQMTASKSFEMLYVPSGVGQGRIPPFVVVVAGKKYETKPVLVTITKATQNPIPNPASPVPDNDDIEVRVLAELSRTRLYLGETTTLQYRLLFRHRVNSIHSPQVIDAPPGFVAEPIEVKREISQIQFEGKPWQQVTLFKQRLTPMRSGQLPIDPVMFQFEADDPALRRGLFSRGRQITVRRQARGLTVNVLGLPAQGRPLEFSGAVGKFEISADLDRDELAAGEAAALTVTLKGTGSLETVTPPSVPEVADIRYFEPDVKDGRRTRRTWIYPVVPQSAGEFTIPPISWSYFDPEAESYKTIESSPLSIRVTPGSGQGFQQAVPSSRRIQALTSDLRFIKPAPKELRDRRNDFYRRSWYWMLVGLPWVAVPSILLAGWQRQRFDRSSYARERRAARQAHKRLSVARSYLDQSNPTEAIRSAGDAMTHYVADRAQRSAQGLTYESLATLAAEAGASNETSQELRRVVERFDELRYTPGGSTDTDAKDLIDQANEAISRLEKEWR